MSIKYENLDQNSSFKALKEYPKIELKKILNSKRIKDSQINPLKGMSYNYAARFFDDNILKILQNLADEAELIPKYKALLAGEVMNTTEKRMVLHHLARNPKEQSVFDGEEDIGLFFKTELKKIKEFSLKVHSGVLKGSTGKNFDTVVQIGIGGSDLGPRAMYIALEDYAVSQNKKKMQAYFVSNVDPDDMNSVLGKINLETTLFVVVSKSGTTQETLTNQEFIFKRIQEQKDLDINKHFVCVTSDSSPMAKSSIYLERFYMNDYIGGRYSSCSAVGGVILSLAYGYDVNEEFLKGLADYDEEALEENILKNAPLLDALLGVYERNIADIHTEAILPYSQALSRFPAHLQQLTMESNGKSVNRFAKNISYQTSPIIWGEPGTNGQHSFYQCLHQGTDKVSLQFIGFSESQLGQDQKIEGSTSQKKLLANLIAQIVAFARGKEDENKAKYFEGNRPSSLIFFENSLNPYYLGALLSHYENKVMFQGFLWNINSFDQEGVQLGKILTKAILNNSGEKDELLATYQNLLF